MNRQPGWVQMTAYMEGDNLYTVVTRDSDEAAWEAEGNELVREIREVFIRLNMGMVEAAKKDGSGVEVRADG